MARRIFITAAEVSGDQHAAQLIPALKELDPSAVVEGLGGPLMQQAGAIVHHQTVRGAQMGAGGIWRALETWRLARWMGRHYEQNRPDLHICVDSPDMNIHFARLAKRRGVGVLGYVAPQVWAWREHRLRKFRRWFDHLACILPFEEPYFRARGLPATFVGHPLFDQLSPTLVHDAPAGSGSRPPVVGLLAGSRHSEAVSNFGDLLLVARQVRARFPGARFFSPTTADTHEVISTAARGHSDICVERDSFDRLVPRCDLCVVVSGTATLHVAAHGVPMIVIYRVNGAMVRLFGWVMKTDTFALVNLLAQRGIADRRVPRSERHIVPEFVPLIGSAQCVADEAVRLLADPALLADQRRKLADLIARHGQGGASKRVARLALEMIAARPPVT
jgi:lipid-A-disaccharide synthase